MSNFANLNGLNNFRNKLRKAQEDFPELCRNILIRVCKAGQEYAHSLYNSSKNIEVTYELYSDFSAKIIAKGHQVAYLEFGTGERGRGTYEGKLPDKSISFHSTRLGQDVTLNTWVYSYAHELDENQATWGGFAAQSQIWKTAQYLRKVIPQIIKEVDI